MTAHRLSPAVERLATLCGAVADSFERGAELLTETAGIVLSESTVERTTEATGERIAQHLQKGRTFGGKVAWDWFRDARGRTVGYIEIDATGVRQQGPGGAAAEGRMANAATIYNPVPDDRRQWANPKGPRPAWQARYLAGLGPLAELGPALRRQGAQVGMDRAQRWIALSDGGSGLEDFLRLNFPRVEAVILDFYHAAEYLGDLAQALHPGDGEAREAWRAAWCHRLKHEGGAAVLEELRGLAVRGRAAKECLKEVVTYFTNQVHRMDYPTYRAKGWQIGSGQVESACKTVVGHRLKGAGMRWGEDGADAVCHLRALFRSEPGQWEGFWSRN